MQRTNNLSLLRKAHRKLEGALIDIGNAIAKETEDLEIVESVEGARAWIEDGVLRITIDECLPRGSVVTKPTKIRWIGKIRRALLDVNIRFKSALVVIEVYSPYPGLWDTDNRAFSMIINGIRYMKVIPDDSHQYMSFMVIGKLDKEDPRTEIFVLENTMDAQTFVSKLKNCINIGRKNF